MSWLHLHQVLARLEKFRKNVLELEKPVEPSSETGSGGADEDVSDWKSVRLKFAPDSKVSFFYHLICFSITSKPV